MSARNLRSVSCHKLHGIALDVPLCCRRRRGHPGLPPTELSSVGTGKICGMSDTEPPSTPGNPESAGAAKASSPTSVAGAALGAATADESYADRLNKLQNKNWKKWLNVQAPYRANLHRHHLGRTLDIGCGNGRNLIALPAGSVGVDHNPHLVASARSLGLQAYTPEELFASPELSAPSTYDAILAAHLIEHLTFDDARAVLTTYLPLVRPGGKVVFITPQERGFASDPTHVTFIDFTELRRLSDDLQLVTLRQHSFPFPRSFGRLFIYNEFNHAAEVPVTNPKATYSVLPGRNLTCHAGSIPRLPD